MRIETKSAHITPVGGNVFADLGFEPEEAAALKAQSQRIISEKLAVKESLIIVAAAELSNRYITDRFLPDKAIELIDEAASKIKIELDSKPEVMDKLDRRLIQLQIDALTRKGDLAKGDDGAARHPATWATKKAAT